MTKSQLSGAAWVVPVRRASAPKGSGVEDACGCCASFPSRRRWWTSLARALEQRVEGHEQVDTWLVPEGGRAAR
jgi:hypothetical protein